MTTPRLLAASLRRLQAEKMVMPLTPWKQTSQNVYMGRVIEDYTRRPIEFLSMRARVEPVLGRTDFGSNRFWAVRARATPETNSRQTPKPDPEWR